MAGALANSIGAPRTVIIGGALCMICAGWFATQLQEIRRQIRPIYVNLGILPEVAAGIQTASMFQTPPE
jgi:hypothetical protein